MSQLEIRSFLPDPNRVGRFDYHNKGLNLLHTIPKGWSVDSFPVIVFPHRDTDVVAGKTYSYIPRLTRSATRVVDGETYRVAHATMMQEVNGEHGDAVDALLNRPAKAKPATIADTPAGSALAALKARLEGGT